MIWHLIAKKFNTIHSAYLGYSPINYFLELLNFLKKNSKHTIVPYDYIQQSSAKLS